MAQELRAPEASKVGMDANFHNYVRHLVECGDNDGQLTAKLTKMRDDLAAQIPEHVPGTFESDLIFQHRCELEYLNGYLEGPGAATVDIMHDRHEEKKHDRARARRIK
jgi:hypothetical protein